VRRAASSEDILSHTTGVSYITAGCCRLAAHSQPSVARTIKRSFSPLEGCIFRCTTSGLAVTYGGVRLAGRGLLRVVPAGFTAFAILQGSIEAAKER
jgi:hypothetical protein